MFIVSFNHPDYAVGAWEAWGLTEDFYGDNALKIIEAVTNDPEYPTAFRFNDEFDPLIDSNDCTVGFFVEVDDEDYVVAVMYESSGLLLNIPKEIE